jgi:hypothetical protein
MINKKLGFYISDNLEFDSKIQACIYGTKNNKDVSWNFNKETFNSYNWSVEPNLTLDQLYDKRARELRETYDYIVISYSGGADSHNLLMSFIRQNLFVDEIVVNTMEKGDINFKNIKNETSAESAPATEHVLQTIPRLREISNLCPNTKINVLDLTDYLLESFKNVGDASWVLNKREKLNPINVTRFNYLYFSEIRKKFDKDKKIAVILGVEKPRVYIHSKTDDIYVRFTDGAANIVGVIADHMKEYPNATIEYFYWSPEAVDIICKQAHLIKKWLRLNPANQKLWYGNNLTNEVYRLIHERVYRSLLYTTWNDSWFQADKAIKDWHTEFDNWFIKGYQETIHYNIWTEGLKYVEEHAYKFLKYSDGQADGLKMFYQDHKVINLNQ